MENNADDSEEVMVRYLLGELNEQDQAEIEERLLGDAEFFQRMQALESALMDDYVTGHLDGERRRRFERILASPGQRQELLFTVDMVNSLRDSKAAAPPSRGIPKSLVWGLAAAGVLVLGSNVVLHIRIARIEQQGSALEHKQQAIREDLEREVAEKQSLAGKLESERNRREALQQEVEELRAAVPATIPMAASLLLAPVSIPRETGGLPSVNVGRGKTQLALKLVLPATADQTSFSVELKTLEGRPVWNKDAITRLDGSSRIAFRVPANVLETSDYVITLKAIEPDGRRRDLHDYPFRVIR